jgi:hypothetical protein
MPLEQLARCLGRDRAHRLRWRAGRHREDDVEGLAPRAVVVDVGAGDTPLVGQLDQAAAPLDILAALVLDLKRLASTSDLFLALAGGVPKWAAMAFMPRPSPVIQKRQGGRSAFR